MKTILLVYLYPFALSVFFGLLLVMLVAFVFIASSPRNKLTPVKQSLYKLPSYPDANNLAPGEAVAVMDDYAARFWKMYESKEIQAAPLDFRIKLSMSYGQWRIDWYDKHNLHSYWMQEAKEGR